MLYLATASTGYRRSELASLTPDSFNLDGDPPTIAAEAAHTKSGRGDAQPVKRELADLLRSWLDGKAAGLPVFERMPRNRARTLRWDLKA